MELTGTYFSPKCISNLSHPEMQSGITIRAHKSRARIINIRSPQLPPEYRIITAEDLGERNTVNIHGCPVPVFAENEVQYLGEPLGMIVGPDPLLLQDLADQTQVTLEELPPVFDREDPETRSVVFEKTIQQGRTSSAIKRAHQLVQGVYRTGLQEHNYLEPLGAYVVPGSANLITVYTPCTDIFLVRRVLASCCGLEEKSIIVEGCFPDDHLDGKLWYPAIIAAQAAAAAIRIQKPVRVLFSHLEDNNFTPKRSPATIRIDSALDDKGKVTAIEASVDIDMGSYPVGAEQILDRMMLQVCGRYKIPAVKVQGRVLSTNVPPLGFFDGWGESACNFAVETHYNRIAEVNLEDPSAFRLRTLTPNGKRLGSGGIAAHTDRIEGVLKEVVRMSNFSRKQAAYELQKKRRNHDSMRSSSLRGIGIAKAVLPPMFTGKLEQRQASYAGIRLEKDGSATILSSIHPGSAASELAWKKIVADTLGLSVSSVRISEPRTDSCPDTGPGTLSRGITIASKIIESCALAASKQRSSEGLPIEVTRPFRLPKGYSKDALDSAIDPYPLASAAAAVIEVEIEYHTLSISVRGIWIAVDGGRILQPAAAIQRIEHGIFASLGFMRQEVLELHQGQLAPSYSMGYRIPRFGQYPDPAISLVDPDQKGPALGIGELPGMCIPAAGIQAVSQATGLYFDQVPITPEILYSYAQSLKNIAETAEPTNENMEEAEQ